MCLEIVNNFASHLDSSISSAFFRQYFVSIVQDIFFVLTDADHKSGFKLQSLLLARLFQLAETNTITAPIFDPATVTNPSLTNALYLKEYTANLLKTAFPHVQPYVMFPLPFSSTRIERTFIGYKFKHLSRRSANIITISTASSWH